MTTSIAVLFSGGGRTVLNVLDSIERGELDATIDLAIASRDEIAGIDRIVDRGIDVAIARTSQEPIATGDKRVQQWLRDYRPDLVCLCGYLRLLEIEPWMEGRVLNIHPSLLPKFGGKGMYGMHVHRAVIDSGENETGCTVHFVDELYDHGETILHLTCPVNEHDTPQCIADKVFSLECEAYPLAIQKALTSLTV